MRILKVTARNFASYQELALDFTDLQGLTLVSGPTGAGKSTLCDLVPWGLFGVTAKNGQADDIRPWGSQSDPTTVQVLLETPQGLLEVTRTRGKVNDLFFCYSLGLSIQRGKDLKDTQRLLNNALGLDLDTYLAGAYMHEFSSTSSFFTANAKTRRTVVEQLVDLSFAVKLTKDAADYKKTVKVLRESTQNELIAARSTVSAIDTQAISNKERLASWDVRHTNKIAELEKANRDFLKIHNQKIDVKALKLEHEKQDLNDQAATIFEASKPILSLKNKLEALSRTIEEHGDGACKECGNKTHAGKIAMLNSDRYKVEREIRDIEQGQIKLVEISNKLKKLDAQIAEVKATPADNQYSAQLEHVRQEVNPYQAVLDQLKENRIEAALLVDTLQEELNGVNVELDDVETLVSLIDTLRAVQVKNTVVELQSKTNQILTTYFNAEIKVVFDLTENDKIDVTIYKDGNSCVYSQLSKGQRQLLKLAFGVSVMGVVNNRLPQSLSLLVFDEVIEGLDETLKMRVYPMLEALIPKHQAILVVDHSEALKAMFHNRIEVELVNGNSQIA